MKILIIPTLDDLSNSNRHVMTAVARAFVELGHDVQRLSGPINAARHCEALTDGLVLILGPGLPEAVDFELIHFLAKKGNNQVAFWITDDPYEFDTRWRYAKLIDHIFCNDRWATANYALDNCLHLPLAACPFTQRREWRSFREREVDVVFAGFAYENRKLILNDIAEIINAREMVIIGQGFDVKRAYHVTDRIDHADLLNIYANARFVINIGRRFSIANAQRNLVPSTPGPRTFEAAMVGVCQLHFLDDHEIYDYYDRDTEILGFRTAADFATLFNDVSADESRWEATVLAAQRRTLEQHTYQDRVRQMLEVITVGALQPA